MLRGRFGATSGRPYIKGQLIIPRLKIAGYVSFLVDTGADSTIGIKTNANALGLDYSGLVAPEQARGVGGNAKVYMERAVLAFAEPRTRIDLYAITIGVFEPKLPSRHLPSLLGGDVLHRWRMSYNHSNGRLFFKVLSADHS
jgi:hypothetical protein